MAAADTWPWLALAGLGAFHGLNPAMGWLFAVALGLQRHDRRVVWLALLPIALGHAVAIAAVAALFVWTGLIVDSRSLHIGAGLVLIGWGVYHWRYGHRHRVRFGMQVGMAGLAAWSLLMSTAHGAGLMLWPALMEVCAPGAADTGAAGAMTNAALGVGLHTVAMLAVTGVIAVAVYEWVGLAVLRSAWINLDRIWTIALLAAGLWLLLA